jgi:hypothetical protein
MPPLIILVRHAEGFHNSTQNYKLHDPLLTPAGHEQCAKLNAKLESEEPLAGQIELVICSPMRRTIQTMDEGLKCVLGRGVRVEMDAGWQGMLTIFGDTFGVLSACGFSESTSIPSFEFDSVMRL